MYVILISEVLIPRRLRRTEKCLLENRRFSRNTDKYSAVCGRDVYFVVI